MVLISDRTVLIKVIEFSTRSTLLAELSNDETLRKSHQECRRTGQILYRRGPV